ncbi:MAG: ABC transporter ATP-binding protein [Chlamydiae bacterium]|nr:ABC transporter ATP-binding protein [Chlamydiota bacterium]
MKKRDQTIFSAFKWAVIEIQHAIKWGMLALIVFIGLQGLLPFMNLYIIKSLTESIGQDSLFSYISTILISWVGLILLENIISPLSQMTRIRMNESIHSHFNLLLMKKANSFSGIGVFESKSFQDEIAILRQETKNKPLNLMYIVTDSMKELVTIASILIFLGTISWWLPFIVTCSVLPQVIFSFFSEKKVWDYSLFHAEDARKMSHICSLTLDRNIAKEIRIYNFGDYFFEKFHSLGSVFYSRMRLLRKRQYFSSIPFSLLAVVGQVAAIGWILWNLKNNALSIASVIVMMQSLHFLHREVLSFIQDMNMLSPVISYFQTFKKFIEQKEMVPSSNYQLNSPVNLIEFCNVSFGYEKDDLILKNLSFSVHRGEKIAIVGANGSGKSTIIKLLCRFYDPQEGSILIDGIDLKEIDIENWRSQLSAVFQDFGRYPLSLGENISFSDSATVDKRKMDGAIKKANLTYLLEKFPEGFHTPLGKEFSGKELSPGEWQKLAISRLFFRNSPIVVMDEPTSSLDPNSEYEIFQRLILAFEGKSVFLITHRLNSVKMCDRILLLKDGRIAEEGTHQKLMALNGDYNKLFSMQASGYQEPEHALL